MIVISHFHNEQYLLPFWLKHHKEIFDHGILIDSNSTDKSVEIIQKIVPDWEIVKSPMKMFDSVKMDELIMEIERKHVGKTKIVLNSTEFLMIENLYAFKKLLSKKIFNYLIPTALMVDIGSEQNNEEVDDLITQKNFGVWHDAINVFYLNKKYSFSKNQRGRFIHNYEDGKYLPGRHACNRNTKRLSKKIAYIRWYYYSPWNKVMIARKLNIRNTISSNDKKNSLSKMHFLDENKYHDTFNYFQKRAYEIPIYNIRIDLKISFMLMLRSITKLIFKIKYSKVFRKLLHIIFPTRKLRKKISNIIFKILSIK